MAGFCTRSDVQQTSHWCTIVENVQTDVLDRWMLAWSFGLAEDSLSCFLNLSFSKTTKSTHISHVLSLAEGENKSFPQVLKKMRSLLMVIMMHAACASRRSCDWRQLLEEQKSWNNHARDCHNAKNVPSPSTICVNDLGSCSLSSHLMLLTVGSFLCIIVARNKNNPQTHCFLASHETSQHQLIQKIRKRSGVPNTKNVCHCFWQQMSECGGPHKKCGTFVSDLCVFFL